LQHGSGMVLFFGVEKLLCLKLQLQYGGSVVLLCDVEGLLCLLR